MNEAPAQNRSSLVLRAVGHSTDGLGASNSVFSMNSRNCFGGSDSSAGANVNRVTISLAKRGPTMPARWKTGLPALQAGVVRGAIKACRLETREPAGARLRGGGDAV
jgi:hypothetical protein